MKSFKELTASLTSEAETSHNEEVSLMIKAPKTGAGGVELDEAVERDPWKQKYFGPGVEIPAKHRVSVTVTDPNHPMVSKRTEKTEKHVNVKAMGGKARAIEIAKDHMQKKGYKVHDANYINEEVSPMIKAPKTGAEFGKKEDAFAHVKKHGGKVMKKTSIDSRSGKSFVSYVVKEEVELEEATRFETAMKSAIASHERGDHKRAKYHLDNAKTARYSLKSTEMSKHRDLLDKYKEMAASHKDLDEGHQVVAKTKEGETFKSGIYPTKQKAMDMHYKMAKSNKYAKVDTVKVEETNQGDTMSTMEQYLAAIEGNTDFRGGLEEKKLTSAELKKREEVAQAIERDNPDMPMDKKMAIATSTAKKVAEEVDQIDEISKQTVGSYIKKATDSVSDKSYSSGEKKLGDPRGMKLDKEVEKRRSNIGKAVDRLTKEELELSESHFKVGDKVKCIDSGMSGTVMKLDKDHGGDDEKYYNVQRSDGKMVKYAPDELEMMSEAKEHTVPKTAKEKELAKMAPPHDKITHADVMVGRGVKKEEAGASKGDEEKFHTQLDKLVHKTFGKSKKEMEEMSSKEKMKRGLYNKEETELDESNHMKMANDIEAYAKKSGGIDKNDMMKVASMLKRGDMKGAEKYTMRLDSDPRDFLLSKMGFNEAKDEQLDELSKKTLGDYIKSAEFDTSLSGMAYGSSPEKRKEKILGKMIKRGKGVAAAVNRLTKEESELDEAMISYSDFMDKIKMHRKAGNKIVDDKYKDGKATYTTINSDGHGRKVTHTHTGQKVENLGKIQGDDDEADVKPSTTETRGRGRPAGSKSGVSKYNK